MSKPGLVSLQAVVVAGLLVLAWPVAFAAEEAAPLSDRETLAFLIVLGMFPL